MNTNYNKLFSKEEIESEQDLENETLESEQDLETEPEEFLKAKIIKCDKLIVRADTTKNSPVVGFITNDDNFVVEQIKGDWDLVHVELKDSELGYSGYVMSRHLEIQEG